MAEKNYKYDLSTTEDGQEIDQHAHEDARDNVEAAWPDDIVVGDEALQAHARLEAENCLWNIEESLRADGDTDTDVTNDTNAFIERYVEAYCPAYMKRVEEYRQDDVR